MSYAFWKTIHSYLLFVWFFYLFLERYLLIYFASLKVSVYTNEWVKLLRLEPHKYYIMLRSYSC